VDGEAEVVTAMLKRVAEQGDTEALSGNRNRQCIPAGTVQIQLIKERYHAHDKNHSTEPNGAVH
jgi:hypothetical protein